MTTFSTSGSHRHSVGSRARRAAARPDDRPSQIHVQAITLAHVLDQAVKLNSSSFPNGILWPPLMEVYFRWLQPSD
jgi:hypothetical protein